MFTGIVEAIGTITEITHKPTTLTISTPPPSPILTDVHLGDSISVNGVCLTVTSFSTPNSTPPSNDWTFTVGLAPETLSRTTFGLPSLSVGEKVNLERAVGGSSSGGESGSSVTRLGGHYVQGHVDTFAEIVEKEKDGESLRLRFRLKDRDRSLQRYIVEKGFICVDGASLTVTEVGNPVWTGEEGWSFGVMLVAYTQEKIVTANKQRGEWVNVEVDMMGKLIEKHVEAHLSGQATWKFIESIVERVVERKLREAGVLPLGK